MSDTLSEQVFALEDQLEHNAKWFSQINSLVGADPEEPAVNSVSDFVHKAMLDREVLEIVRDENEVNKKNVFKFSEENMKLRQENSELKKGHAAMRSFASTMFESMECCPYTGDERKEFSYYVKDCEFKIQKEKDGSVWEDIVEELKEAASKKIKAQEEEIEKLKAEVKRLIDWDKTTCDFCENDSSHLVRRDAGHDERTCDYCHKEQYPEEYEEE